MEDLATNDPEGPEAIRNRTAARADEDFKNGVSEIKTDWLAETDIDRKGSYYYRKKYPAHPGK